MLRGGSGARGKDGEEWPAPELRSGGKGAPPPQLGGRRGENKTANTDASQQLAPSPTHNSGQQPATSQQAGIGGRGGQLARQRPQLAAALLVLRIPGKHPEEKAGTAPGDGGLLPF